MTAAPVSNHPCDVCGQLDDHPMIHALGQYVKDGGRVVIDSPSFHFDCIPAEYEALLVGDPHHEVARATIEAARAGTHGDDLREFIASQPNDNDLPDDVEPATNEDVTP